VKKTWLVAIGVVLLLVVVGMVGCSSEGGVTLSGETSTLKIDLNNQQQGIWVNGEGKVTAVPDVAVLSLGIESQELTVAEAQARASEAMDKVMKALKDAGIDDKDIQTQYFNIQKVTRWDSDKQEEIVIGYRVTNTVTAKVRKVDEAGSVIDAVAAAGGDLTRTAVKLGKPTYISESSYIPGPIYRDVGVKAEGVPATVETPISPGEMEITTSVQMAYAIID